MRMFKYFLNFEKEEKWLEDMAARGWRLKRVSFAYEFEQSIPAREVIRIDYRTFKSQKDFEDYKTLFEDSGWLHMAGTKNSGSQYFKKISPDGSGDIFSDTASRAGRYKRIAEMWLRLSAVYVPFLALSMRSGDKLFLQAFTNPKALFYTPGLWDMSGFDFWRHFLFELIFAIGRGYAPYIFILVIFLSAGFNLRAERLYKKAMKE